MTLVLPNPNSPQNGQPLDATVVYQNQTAIAQAIQSFDATQIQAGTLSNHTAFSAALDPQTRLKETGSNFVSSGCSWSVVSGLQGTMSGGVVYIQGIRVPVNGVNSYTFTASQDTYVDIDYNGNVYYVPVANGAISGMTLTANSIRVAKIVSNASVLTIYQYSYDPLGNQIFNRNPYAFSGFAVNNTATTITTSTTLVSLTLTNALAGDYLITSNWSVSPSGGGNGSMQVTLSGTNGVLAYSANQGGGIHAADGDYNTTKWSHRYPINRLLGHQGGTFTVSLVFSPESAVNFMFNNSGDPRWGTTLHVART